MRVKSAIIRQACSALYESVGYDMIDRISKRVIPGYDLHYRSGIPENIPITAQMAARQLVNDVVRTGRFLHLLEIMIDIDLNGFMGREYRIGRLSELIKSVLAEGYIYDRMTGLFMENSKERITSNWGRLTDNEERQIALLRLDIVDNSTIVRSNPSDKVQHAYGELRNMVNKSVIPRLGRVWVWEGDGCLCGFLFNKKERSAILAGMEILHALYFYNLLHNQLDKALQVRIACHSGPFTYNANLEQLKKNEIVREVTEIESRHASPGSLATTENMIMTVDRHIQDKFKKPHARKSSKYRLYSVGVEAV